MALFEIFKGEEDVLDRKKLHEGYAYFCEDSGRFFIDTDEKRVPLKTTKTYTVTLIPSNWEDPEQGETEYVYFYENNKLMGTSAPLISCIFNNEEYSLITSAEAFSGEGIYFRATKKPNYNIGLVITDLG